MDLTESLLSLLGAVPPPGPATAPDAGSPAPTPTPVLDAKPIAQLVFIVMGLAIATIVLVAGLLAIAALRRTRRTAAPTRTPHVDAWAESGRRARPEPSARDILGGGSGGGFDGDGDD